jgi:hypothetical protein
MNYELLAEDSEDVIDVGDNILSPDETAVAQFVGSVFNTAGSGELASQSGGISGGSEVVILSDKHVNVFSNLGQIILRRSLSAIDLDVALLAIIVHTENGVVEHLRPVDHVLDTGTSRVVTRSDLESLGVIDGSVSIRQKSDSSNTEGVGKDAGSDVNLSGGSGHPAELLLIDQIGVDVEELTSFDPTSNLDKRRSTVLEENSGSKGNEFTQVLNNGGITSGQSSKHDGASFTVSDIVDLLASDSSNVLDTSGQIILRHFLPREGPELVVTVVSVE